MGRVALVADRVGRDWIVLRKPKFMIVLNAAVCGFDQSLGTVQTKCEHVNRGWHFEQQHFSRGDWQSYTFESSETILAEAIKTQRVCNPDTNSLTDWVIRQDANSPISEKRWSASVRKLSPLVGLSAAVSAGDLSPARTPICIFRRRLRRWEMPNMKLSRPFRGVSLICRLTTG